jgi:hypothetical protein
VLFSNGLGDDVEDGQNIGGLVVGDVRAHAVCRHTCIPLVDSSQCRSQDVQYAPTGGCRSILWEYWHIQNPFRKIYAWTTAQTFTSCASATLTSRDIDAQWVGLSGTCSLARSSDHLNEPLQDAIHRPLRSISSVSMSKRYFGSGNVCHCDHRRRHDVREVRVDHAFHLIDRTIPNATFIFVNQCDLFAKKVAGAFRRVSLLQPQYPPLPNLYRWSTVTSKKKPC